MRNIRKIGFSAANGLLLLAPAFASAQLTGGNWTDRGTTNVASTGLPTGSIYGIISSTLSWLLAILGFVAVMGFVISGIQYLIAAGDESMIERAKTNMTYSIIGVIVALMGYVIVQAVEAWLGTSASF